MTGPDGVILTLYPAVLAQSELPDSIRIHVKADAGCRLKEKIVARFRLPQVSPA